MTKKKYDAVATIGEYTNREGEKKKRYLTVGTVFEDDQGRLSMKLDALPCSKEWSGWISFYDPKPYGEQRQTTHEASKQNAYQPDFDDDIPM